MSDSGFTGPPPVTPPTTADVRAQRNDVLKVVDMAAGLRDNARLQRIAGEIVADSKDGTMRIATTQGDITVQKPANRPDLALGAKVEIDVPAGHPPRQVAIREITPPAPQSQPQAPARDTTASRDNAPAPVITAPPRPPVSIPEQPYIPPPQAAPALVTPEQIIRLLPLPPAQATQIVQPPADIVDVILPALPPAVIAANIIAQNAPQALTDELVHTLLTAPAPQTQVAAQQIANVIAPQLPPSAYVTPAPLPGGLPPAVQNTAQQMMAQILDLNNPASSPLLSFTPAAAAAPSPAPFSLLTAKLPPAMAAFAALAPENLIQSSPAAPVSSPFTHPPSTGTAIPKMDAQILGITTPAVAMGPAASAGIQTSDNPFMPSLSTTAFPAPPAVQAGMLEAQVRGATAQNFPVLSVAFPSLNATQDFIMQFPTMDMITGATVTVQPQPGTLAPVTAAAAPFAPLPELMIPGLWPAMDEAFQALQSAAPQAAQLMANTAMANPGNPAAAPRMPAIIMMFVAAMQGGDMQNWLGDRTIDTLRRIGKADVVSRIARDGAALSRLAAADAPAQDWRSMPVPMMWDNHVHKIMLHYRHDREPSRDGEEKKKGTRFILDIAPPRMGNVQLDGLHRPGDSNGRLDLIVRTGENLSPSMQQAMRRLYVHALEQAQLSGELSFQNKSGAWVTIAP